MFEFNFATRVRGIEFGPVKKQIDTSELQKMKAMLEKARNECRMKDDSIRKLEENLQSMESKAKGKDSIHRNLQERIKELENQIELKTSMQNQSERQVFQLSDKLKAKEETCSILQYKVKELERNMKEQLQAETSNFQQKVWDLEKKLKDQLQESESQSAMLKHKVEELERKLKEQEQSSDLLLHQKLKEAEERFREREQQRQQIHYSVDAVKATPDIRKSCMSDDSEINPRIFKSSNAVNRQLNQGSNMSRSKRTSENNLLITSSSSHGSKVTRKSDPPKIGRAGHETNLKLKENQAPLTQKRASRDQVQGSRERDNKKKIWSR